MIDSWKPGDVEIPPVTVRKKPALGRDSLFTMLSQVIALGAAFLTSMMTARALGPSGKGELALLTQTPALFAVALNLGLGTSAAYFVGRARLSSREAFSDSFAVLAVLSVIGFPLCAIAMASIRGLESVDTALLLLASLTLPLALASVAQGGILTGLGQVRTLATRQALAQVVGLTIIAGLFALNQLDLRGCVTASVVALAAANIGMALAISRSGGLLAMPSLNRIRRVSSYSFKAYVAGISSYLEKRQDVVLLGILSTPRDVGIYSIGVMFTELLWQIPRALAAPLMSRSLSEDPNGGASVAARAARVTFGMMVAGSALMALLVGPTIRIFYTSAFSQASMVFFILIPGTVIYGIGSLLWNYMMANGRLFPVLSITVALLNLVANIMLIPSWGMLGAALSSSVSYTIGGMVLIGAFVRMTGLPVRAVMWPHSEDLTAVVASLKATVRRGSEGTGS